MGLKSNVQIALEEACQITQVALVEMYPQFDRIWVHYSRPSKKREEFNITLTIFPVNRGQYFFLFSQGSPSISIEIASRMIDEHLEGVN